MFQAKKFGVSGLVIYFLKEKKKKKEKKRKKRKEKREKEK